MEIDLEVTNYVRDLFKEKTARDKQRIVGASQVSDPCTKCLAEAMATGANHQSEYNMGARVGTAIHEWLELNNPDPHALKEYNGLIDVVPGYGDIRSTTDLYRLDKKNLVDFKTSTRDKLEKYQHDWEREIPNATLDRYFRQATLYAYMVEGEVEKVSIVFICRDGQIVDRDIVGFSIPYQENIAVNAMNRVKKIWAYLESGGRWEDCNSYPGCFTCERVRPLIASQEIDEL